MSRLARATLAAFLALPVSAQAQAPSNTYYSPSGSKSGFTPWTGATTTTPSANAAPLTAETNSFQFTVTNGQDNALPVAPSNPGLTLPGRVCIDYPQQAYGSGTTNAAYININWDGANAFTTPHDQLAAGEHEICKYVTTTTPPHLAVNSGASSPVIGVTN